MKRKKRQPLIISIIALIAAFAFIVLSLIPTFIAAKAATQAELQSKLQESQQKKEKAQKQLQDIQYRKEIAVDEVKQLDGEIDSLENEIEIVNGQIYESETAIEQKNIEIEQQKENIAKYKNDFIERARVMYKRGPTSYLDVFLGANDFSDLLNRTQMIKKVTEYDQRVLKEMADAQAAIEAAKAAIEEEKAGQELNRQTLENNQAALESKRNEKSVVIEQLNQDAEKAKALEDEADAEMEQFRNELASMSSSGAASSSSTSTSVASYGSMQWPAVASKTITSPYGNRFHPIQKVNRFHSGIDIGAPYGTGIVAAESGKVIKAAWNGGYGKCIVIDHGGGIYTLYGHCSQINVSVGQSVSRGETIGLIGSTGNSTGPHLHFEVLINGSTTNPLSYVG